MRSPENLPVMAKPRIPLEVPRRREIPDVPHPFPEIKPFAPGKKPAVVPVEPGPVRVIPKEPVPV